MVFGSVAATRLAVSSSAAQCFPIMAFLGTWRLITGFGMAGTSSVACRMALNTITIGMGG